MGWVTSANSGWINTQKSVSTELARTQDFSGDSTTGNRYVAIFVTTVTMIAEKRGLTDTEALALAAPSSGMNQTDTFSSSDSAANSPYSISLPGFVGTTIKYDATRANEADGWTVVRTTTTKSATATWASGSYSDAVGTAIGLHKSTSVRYYTQNLAVKWVPSYYLLNNTTGLYEPQGSHPVVWNINTVESTEEWTGLTESAAKSKAATLGSGVVTIVETDGTTWEHESHVAEARYAGTQGWTVTYTHKTSTIVSQ